MVKLEDFQEQLHAEDEELDYLTTLLKRANAYIRKFINRPYDDLDEDEKELFDQVVMEIATNFYLNRDGSAKGVSQSYSGLNVLIDTLRKPNMFYI